MVKRRFFHLALLAMLSLACACQSAQRGVLSRSEVFMLIGSYAGEEEEGVKVYALDTLTGQARYLSGAKGMGGPSFLAPTADGRMVYAVGESSTPVAYSLAFDRHSGSLSLLGSQPTDGAGPCHISLSPGEDFAVTANYFGKNITLIPIGPDRLLAPGKRLIPFEGSGIDPERQQHPFLHSSIFTPDGKYLLAADLGTDRIHRMALGGRIGDIKVLEDVAVEPGSGPRHMAAHPGGKYMYLINELSGRVTAFAYSEGELEAIQYVAADTVGARGSADIHVSADGRFLYASNRLKADGIAIFAIDQATGKLSRAGYQPTGIHPRNFGIAPGGRFVLVACRDTHEVQIFARDQATGLLSLRGRVETPQPVCVKFVCGE